MPRYSIFILVWLATLVPALEADSFLYSNGVFTTLSVPGAMPGTTVASGINDSGQVVGSFQDGTGLHGFLDSHGVFTTIDYPGAAGTEVDGINNAGQVIGTGFPSLGPGGNGFVYANGFFTTLPLRGPQSINDAGEIVGWYATCPVILECAGSFQYLNGIVTNIGIPPTPPADSSETFAYGVNNHGDIIGWYRAGIVHQAITEQGGFIMGGSVLTRVPDVYFYGINDAGEIVGSSGNHGLLYDNAVFTTIDFPASSYTSPNGINQLGMIVGAFTPTPEPASLVLVASSLLAIGAVILRRRHP